MTVSRKSPAFIAPLLIALLLGGCAETPLKRATAPMPAPNARPITHAPVNPDLPSLPPAGSGRGGYYLDDGPGDNPPPNLGDIADAVVRAEPYARYANRPYVVFGKRYTPMLDERPFVQRGHGSWYGKKFHGQKTASGEIYNMYKMTAAHPTLPIPSYARVTSVATGKAVVVRINDRGPFHAGRVIDLSYTAAAKLGFLQSGGQQVTVERLLPDGAAERLATALRNAPEPEDATGGALAARAEINELIVENRAEVKAARAQSDGAAPASSPPPSGFYVQLGAFSRAGKAFDIRARVAGNGWGAGTLDVVRSGMLHKVLSGPFATRDLALEAARGVPAVLGLKPIVVQR